MLQKLREIASKYHLCDVYAFGSQADRAIGRLSGMDSVPFRVGSDLDIGVRTTPGFRLTARDRAALMTELEDLFSVSRVDLVILDEADPFIALDIIRGRLLYAEDRDSQAHYELYVLRRAGDLMPFKKERIAMILEEGAL